MRRVFLSGTLTPRGRRSRPQTGKAHLREQRLDGLAFGGLRAAAHDVRRTGGGREADSVLLAQSLRLGIRERRDHAVACADRTADRDLEALGVNRAALSQIERAAAAERDHDPFNAALEQPSALGGQFLEGLELFPGQTRQLVVVRLDEVRRGLDPFREQRAVRIEEHPCARLLHAAVQVR